MKTPRPPGRPRAFDESAAVETAAELFRARGYGGVGVAELAAAIGINPPSLYGAFGSKAGLFGRALARYSEDRTGFAAAALEEPDLPGLVRSLLRGAADAYVGAGDCAGCLAIETARDAGEPAAREAALGRVEATRRALAARIAAEAPACAEALADALLVAMAGLSAVARMGVSRDRLLAAADIAAAGVLAGLPART